MSAVDQIILAVALGIGLLLLLIVYAPSPESNELLQRLERLEQAVTEMQRKSEVTP